MRRRVREPGPSIEVVPILAPARLLTLEESGAAPRTVQDAFVRLRPPPDTPEDDVASWRDLVASAGALAVRVLPAPRAALPDALSRPAASGTLRDEALALAVEEGGEIETLVRRIVDEVGL